MTLYRALFLIFVVPVLAVRLLARLALRRDTPADLDQRLGGGAAAGVARGPVIWLHAASVGEATAARVLVETLLERDPRLRLVVTTNTPSGRAAVAGWGLARVSARLAPVDLRWCVRRFLAGWQPAALVTIENEIWPVRMAVARQRRIPVAVAGARLSARSARLWARLPGAARDILGLADLVAAQDAETEARLVSLGLPRRRLARRLNLKASVRLAAPDPDRLAAYAAALPYDRTLLAASTHPGEDEVVLAAFRKMREFDQRLKLILAPRHPERGDELATMIAGAGQPMARRARDEMPDERTTVFLADSLGEMGLWMRLAAITFLGGSLVEKGGHTPFEPAQAGSAILHGPHVANNAEAYRALDLAGGAMRVDEAGSLAAAGLKLLGDPGLRRAMVTAAGDCLGRLGSGGGAVQDFVARLGALIGDPRLEGRPEPGVFPPPPAGHRDR